MATIESLSREVAAIRTRIAKPGDPKHWTFLMAEGAEIPECVASQMAAHDTVFIRPVRVSIFYGMFGPDALGSCTVITTHGNYIVAMDSGKWTKVQTTGGRKRGKY